MAKNKQEQELRDEDIHEEIQQDPFLFVKMMWWLVPQQVLPKYENLLDECRATGDYDKMKLVMFEPFEKGKHLTWHQTEILLSVMNGSNWLGPWRISTRSWHGIGKSSVIAMIVLWFLYSFADAQIPCTAPTDALLKDILWKEITVWKDRMPELIRAKYEITDDYVRIVESPKTWFARARTARKWETEALAGIHSEHVLALADEWSWVADEVYNVGKGAFTGPHKIFLIISNPTRTSWYFHSTQTKWNRFLWRAMNFNSEESPIVDESFVEQILEESGPDSDEYKVRVMWHFPRSDLIDEKWWIPLLQESDIRFIPPQHNPNFTKLWVDPAWQWTDEALWIWRNSIFMQVLQTEPKSTEKTIAYKTDLILVEHDTIKDDQTYVDNFGSWANVWVELAILKRLVKCVNRNIPASNPDKFANKRAECYWRLRERARAWWEFVNNPRWKDLLMIKYKRDAKWRIQIISKEEMKKEYGKSPDAPDAWALTFWEVDKPMTAAKKQEKPRTIVNPHTWEVTTQWWFGNRKATKQQLY